MSSIRTQKILRKIKEKFVMKSRRKKEKSRMTRTKMMEVGDTQTRIPCLRLQTWKTCRLPCTTSISRMLNMQPWTMGSWMLTLFTGFETLFKNP